MMHWLFATYLFVFLTTFVKQFKSLGAGFFYVYNSLPPFLFLFATNILNLSNYSTQNPLYILFLMLLFAACVGNIIAIYQYRKTIVRDKDRNLSEEISGMLDNILQLPKKNIMCVPTSLADMVAYKTNKRVLWGGHSGGFNKHLKDFFPIIRKPFEHFIDKYAINYIFINKQYISDDFKSLSKLDLNTLNESSNYILYEINSSKV